MTEQRTPDELATDFADKNRFVVAIQTELGCSIEKDEYSVFIVKLLEGMIGKEDYDLVEECIAEVVDRLPLPPEGWTEFEVYETGEREDVFWNKYYKVVGHE